MNIIVEIWCGMDTYRISLLGFLLTTGKHIIKQYTNKQHSQRLQSKVTRQKRSFIECCSLFLSINIKCIEQNKTEEYSDQITQEFMALCPSMLNQGIWVTEDSILMNSFRLFYTSLSFRQQHIGEESMARHQHTNPLFEKIPRSLCPL